MFFETHLEHDHFLVVIKIWNYTVNKPAFARCCLGNRKRQDRSIFSLSDKKLIINLELIDLHYFILKKINVPCICNSEYSENQQQ